MSKDEEIHSEVSVDDSSVGYPSDINDAGTYPIDYNINQPVMIITLPTIPQLRPNATAAESRVDLVMKHLTIGSRGYLVRQSIKMYGNNIKFIEKEDVTTSLANVLYMHQRETRVFLGLELLPPRMQISRSRPKLSISRRPPIVSPLFYGALIMPKPCKKQLSIQ